GRVDQGLSLLQQGVAVHDSSGIGLLRTMSVVQLAEAYLLADQTEDARTCADRAVRLARERGEHAYEAWLSASLARSPYILKDSTSPPPRRTSAPPWRWLPTATCVPSSLTAASASASCTAARAMEQRPRSTSLLRRRCTARWTCVSGCTSPRQPFGGESAG